MAGNKPQLDFIPLRVAVVTVSDTRTEDTDTSGQFLRDALQAAGHFCCAKHICKRDNTVVAVTPLFDSSIDGFGELFRQLSFQEIGTSTIQSRAFAGLSNSTAVFCMPGSTGACRTAWNGIIAQQLDSRHRPCNFVDRLMIKGS